MNKSSLYRISSDKDVKKFLGNLKFKEYGSTANTATSQKGLRPHDVAEMLGFKADFTEKVPFCHIKTNTRIWELFFLRNQSSSFTFEQYRQLTRSFTSEYFTPFDGCTRVRIGIQTKNIKTKEENWINAYSEITDSQFIKTSKIFTKHFIAKSRLINGKLLPLRAKSQTSQRAKKDIQVRRNAAREFFKYMVNVKDFKLTKADIKNLKEKKLEEEKLCYLMERCSNLHIFFVCLMLCLFGRSYTNDKGTKKYSLISKELVKTTIRSIGRFSDSQMAEKIKTDLNMELMKQKKQDSIKPIYRKNVDKKYFISFRLNTWIHLLTESMKAF